MASCVALTFVIQYLFTEDFSSGVELYRSRRSCFSMCYSNSSCASVLYDNSTHHCILTRDLLSVVTLASSETTGYWYYELRTGGCDWTSGWKYHRPSETCLRLLPPTQQTYNEAEAECSALDASLITGEDPQRAQMLMEMVDLIDEDILVGARTNGTTWFWTSNQLVDPDVIDIDSDPGDCLIATEIGYSSVLCNSTLQVICRKLLN